MTVTVTNTREKIGVIASPSPSPSGSHKPKPTDDHTDYYEPGSGSDSGSATGGILSVVAALFLAIALAAWRRPASRDRRRPGAPGDT